MFFFRSVKVKWKKMDEFNSASYLKNSCYLNMELHYCKFLHSTERFRQQKRKILFPFHPKWKTFKRKGKLYGVIVKFFCPSWWKCHRKDPTFLSAISTSFNEIKICHGFKNSHIGKTVLSNWFTIVIVTFSSKDVDFNENIHTLLKIKRSQRWAITVDMERHVQTKFLSHPSSKSDVYKEKGSK